MDNQPRQKSEPRRALRLALTEPEVVQIPPAQVTPGRWPARKHDRQLHRARSPGARSRL